MKRFITAALAFAMVLALAMTSAASTTLSLYVKDDDGDYYTEEVTTPAPGQTVYGLLTENKPQKLKASHNIVVYSVASDKKVSLIGSSSFEIVKRKVGSGSSDYAYFAEIKIKEVSSSAYEDDGYYASGELTFTNSTGSSVTYDVDFNIEYPEGYDELTEDLQIFSYEKDDEVELELPDGESTFEFEAAGNSDVLASMTTDYDFDFADKYPNANLDFYYSNGATFDRLIRGTGILTIYADSDSYLYEIKSGSLVDLTKTYDKDEDAFIVKSTGTTFTLGKYVVSNTRLSGAVASSSSAASSVSSSSGGTYVPINPNTGAAA